jgi:hypothetical protein
MSDEALNPTPKSETLEAALASVWQRQAELGVVARRPGKRAIESDLKAALRELITDDPGFDEPGSDAAKPRIHARSR